MENSRNLRHVSLNEYLGRKKELNRIDRHGGKKSLSRLKSGLKRKVGATHDREAFIIKRMIEMKTVRWVEVNYLTLPDLSGEKTYGYMVVVDGKEFKMLKKDLDKETITNYLEGQIGNIAKIYSEVVCCPDSSRYSIKEFLLV